ncbi:MAG TPA: hypothetical protein VFU87_05795 [Sphingomicrobium sp.]|jgi:hypothetical protein|nr:hypothetical protein [Sphingomicrobium sp.]
MDHSTPRALADPIPDRAFELKLEQFTASHSSRADAGPPHVRAELDRYDIAVVFQAVYEWRDYRYSNALDAIAAAKRGRK